MSKAELEKQTVEQGEVEDDDEPDEWYGLSNAGC